VKPASRFEVRRRARRSGGFSLIDVLLVIVLLGVMSGALMTLSGRVAVQSAEAMKTRQALTIAQALLDEVRHMPFTFCDPSDVRASIATSATPGAPGCTNAAMIDALGSEPGESRTNAFPNRFDGVTDYDGFASGTGCGGGLCKLDGSVLTVPTSSLAGCNAGVTVTAQAINSIPAFDANGQRQVLRIGVTVTCPGTQPLLLEGIRVRHAPNLF
jgi:MSHA pilin protein MshD